MDYLNSINILLDSDVVITSQSKVFYDTYKIQTHTTLILNKLGLWDEENVIKMSLLERRNDLNGTSIPGTIVVIEKSCFIKSFFFIN